MEHLVNAVKAAVSSKNWYAALTLSLTLPDICAGLSKGSKARQLDYFNWCASFLCPYYLSRLPGEPEPFLTGRDVYSLRCAFLHQGDFEVEGQSAGPIVKKFDFLIPKENRFVHNNFNRDNVLQLQVDVFCDDVCRAVISWLQSVNDDPATQARISELAKVRTIDF